MPHYNIDDPGRIRILVSRAAALHTVREHLCGLYEWCAPSSREVGSRFESICEDVDVWSATAPTNDAAVLKLRETLRSELDKAPLPAHEHDHAALRDHVVQALTAAGADIVCPFTAIIDYACDQASAWFGEHWPDYLAISIEGATGPDYGKDCRYFVNGWTEPGSVTTVHLSIWTEKLNFETYAAIFAVLVHELVCHVPAPPIDAIDPNDSVFAEGFADWAAGELFERWLGELDELLRDAAGEFGGKIRALTMTPGGAIHTGTRGTSATAPHAAPWPHSNA
jgi:hypothetical protein